MNRTEKTANIELFLLRMRAVLFQRRRCYLKEGNNMLAPIFFFICAKLTQHL